MLPWAVAEQYWECYQSSRCLCCISTTAHQSFLAQQQKKTGRYLYSHIKRMAAGHVELPYLSPALHAILQAQPHPWKPQMASSSWFKSHLGCCLCWPGCLTDHRDGRGLCAFKPTFGLGPFLQRTHRMDGCPWFLLTFQAHPHSAPSWGILWGHRDSLVPVTEVGHAGNKNALVFVCALFPSDGDRDWEIN